jgi:ribose 5-phosphate isomerase B
MIENNIKIALGSDHAGFELKEQLKIHLKDMGYDIKDYGTNSLDSVDYPDIAKSVCEGILAGECIKGILVCGTGLGMSISANKIKGIRAAVCSDTFSAKMASAHNDCQILAIGGRVVGMGLAVELVSSFLETNFDTSGRHKMRIDKIMSLDM